MTVNEIEELEKKKKWIADWIGREIDQLNLHKQKLLDEIDRRLVELKK